MVNSCLSQEFKEIRDKFKLKKIDYKEKKDEENIPNWINEHFYSLTQGVNLRTLKAKITEGIVINNNQRLKKNFLFIVKEKIVSKEKVFI